MNAMHSPQAVARRLSISYGSVLALIASGRLRAVNVGSGTLRPCYRVSEAALAAFIDGPPTARPKPTRRRRMATTSIDYFAGGGK